MVKNIRIGIYFKQINAHLCSVFNAFIILNRIKLFHDYLFIFFFQIEVMLSMPNKDVEHINNISTISAAGIVNIVQNIVKNKQTIQPKNPATLLLLTELSDDSICFINRFII